MFQIVQVFSFGQLSPGDRLQIYEYMRTALEPLRPGDLIVLIDRGMGIERIAIQRESLWTGAVRRATFAPVVVDIDAEVDYDTGVVYRVLKAHAMGDPSRDPLVPKAQRMLAALFPAGLAAITALPYVRQVGAMEVMVERLQAEFAPDVADLGLSVKVERLAERTAAYRRAITAQTTDITFAEVQEAREDGRRFFCRVLAQILASYYDEEDPARMAICEKLMAHVIKQDAQYRGRRRARRARAGSAAGSEGSAGSEGGAGEGTAGEEPGGAPQES